VKPHKYTCKVNLASSILTLTNTTTTTTTMSLHTFNLPPGATVRDLDAVPRRIHRRRRDPKPRQDRDVATYVLLGECPTCLRPLDYTYCKRCDKLWPDMGGPIPVHIQEAMSKAKATQTL